jgi:hypothetical protein
MTLLWSKPVRKADNSGQSYFHFEQQIQKTHYNVTWLPVENFIVADDIVISVLEEFLQFSSAFFVKPPSIEHMKKHLEIQSSGLNSNEDPTRYEFDMYPMSIDVYSKKTVINWYPNECKTIIPKEQIPSDFLEQSRPSSPTADNDTRNIVITSDPVQNAIMEAVADIPLQESHPFRLDDDAEERMYRLRVMEARLSAKLASFKVQKEREKYLSKFGRLPPDVEDSEDETDYEDSDDSEE